MTTELPCASPSVLDAVDDIVASLLQAAITQGQHDPGCIVRVAVESTLQFAAYAPEWTAALTAAIQARDIGVCEGMGISRAEFEARSRKAADILVRHHPISGIVADRDRPAS